MRLILWPFHSNGASASDSEMPPLDLLGIEVGRGGAVLDPALTVDGAGAVEQRLGQRGLAGSAVADQGDVADLGGGEALHRAPHLQPLGAVVSHRTADGTRTVRLAGSVCVTSDPTFVPLWSTMFDGRWRPSVEQKLRPVGANLRRTGITADHLTAAGLVMAVGASIAIANGALRAGFLLLVLTAVPDVLDGAVAKASGTASPRGAFFDSVADRVTDALLLGGVAWYLAEHNGGHIAVLPLAVLGTSMLISYERAKAESLGFDAKGGLMERAERIIALGVGLVFEAAHPRAVADARAHHVHRRAAVRQGVAPGQRPRPPALALALRRWRSRRVMRPGPRERHGARRKRTGRRSEQPGAAARLTRSRPDDDAESTAGPASGRQRAIARDRRPWPTVPPAQADRRGPRLSPDRRAQVERNLRRVYGPDFGGLALRRAVDKTFESYARYWAESFRLPGTADRAELDAGMSRHGGRAPRGGAGRRARGRSWRSPPGRVGLRRRLVCTLGYPGHRRGRAGRAARAVRVVRRAAPVARHGRSCPSARQRAPRCSGR